MGSMRLRKARRFDLGWMCTTNWGHPSGLGSFVDFLLLWSRRELLRHRGKAVQLENGRPIVIITSDLDVNARLL
jgi:hypothetical protein